VTPNPQSWKSRCKIVDSKRTLLVIHCFCVFKVRNKKTAFHDVRYTTAGKDIAVCFVLISKSVERYSSPLSGSRGLLGTPSPSRAAFTKVWGPGFPRVFVDVGLQSEVADEDSLAMLKSQITQVRQLCCQNRFEPDMLVLL
jgi:hypothetical protein